MTLRKLSTHRPPSSLATTETKPGAVLGDDLSHLCGDLQIATYANHRTTRSRPTPAPNAENPHEAFGVMHRIDLFAHFGYMSSREPAGKTSPLGRCCPVAAAYGFRPAPSLTCGSRRAP